MDVDTVFLNASISENIWVKVPDEIELPPGDDGIYTLQKSLCGLKQAPRECNHCKKASFRKFRLIHVFLRRRTRTWRRA
jgi:Reverse transcriptase (RNA-dependent DNA polymerase)